jgi:hypothetical protein
MSGWSVVRVAAPVCVGLGLVALRPSWVSVATLGLLIVVGAWLDSQERRADDVKDVAADVLAETARLGERLTSERKAGDLEVLGAAAGDHDRLKKRLDEHERRLDAMAQQRKGPIL